LIRSLNLNDASKIKIRGLTQTFRLRSARLAESIPRLSEQARESRRARLGSVSGSVVVVKFQVPFQAPLLGR